MKICIDINSTLKSSSTGIGMFTVALVKALASLSWSNEHKLVLCYRKRFFDFKKRCPNIKSNSIKYVNVYKRDLPKADICLTSSFGFKPSPYGKSILIIHDLIPLVAPELSSIDTRSIVLSSLPRLIKDVDCIVCVSHNTRNDLLRFYPDAQDKTKVIYPVIDPMYKVIEDKNKLKKRLHKLGIVDDYILFVSTIEPRKNLLSLLKAFPKIKEKFPEIKLVVVGKYIKSYKDVEEYIKTYELKEDLISLGYVKQEDLVFLYNGAKVLVFPSFYEGFGLPIAEAFSCGTPVVTSNISSMREIAEGAAELVNPYSIDSIAAGVIKVLKDNDYRDDLVKNGSNKVKNFGLDLITRQYRSMMEDILGQKIGYRYIKKNVYPLTIDIGGLIVELNANHSRYLDYLKVYFNKIVVQSNLSKKPQISININWCSNNFNEYFLKLKSLLDGNMLGPGTFIANNRIAALKKVNNKKKVLLDLTLGDREIFLNAVMIRKFLKDSMRYALPSRSQEELFFAITYPILYYTLFWYLEYFKQTHILHASAVEFNNIGLIICGLEGIGKTSLALSLLQNRDSRFISDNLIFYDKERVYPCYELVRIHKNESELLWRDKFNKIDRFKVSKSFYSPNTVDDVKNFKPDILIFPQFSSKFTIRELNTLEAVNKAIISSSIPAELNNYMEYSSLYNWLVPDFNLSESRKSVLDALLSNVRCYEVGMVKSEGLDKNVERLKETLLKL